MEYTSNTDTILRGEPDYEIRVDYNSYDSEQDMGELITMTAAAVFSCGHVFSVVYFTSNTDILNETDAKTKYVFNCAFGIRCGMPMHSIAFYLSKITINIAYAIYTFASGKICLYSMASGREVAIVNDFIGAQRPTAEICALRIAALNNCTDEWLSGMDIAEHADMFCRMFGCASCGGEYPSNLSQPFGVSDKFTSENPTNCNEALSVRVSSGLTTHRLYSNDTDISVFKDICISPYTHEFVVCKAYGISVFDYNESYHLFVFMRPSACLDGSVVFTAEFIPSDVNAVERVAEFTGISKEDAQRYVTQAVERTHKNI